MLRKLLAEIEAITEEEVEAVKWLEPIAEGETVVIDSLSLDLRKFWVHLDKAYHGLNERIEASKELECIEPHDKATCLRCRTLGPLKVATGGYAETSKFFWVWVKDGMTDETKCLISSDQSGGIGIREGWKIVSVPPKTKEDDCPVMIGVAMRVPAVRFG